MDSLRKSARTERAKLSAFKNIRIDVMEGETRTWGGSEVPVEVRLDRRAAPRLSVARHVQRAERQHQRIPGVVQRRNA